MSPATVPHRVVYGLSTWEEPLIALQWRTRISIADTASADDIKEVKKIYLNFLNADDLDTVELRKGLIATWHHQVQEPHQVQEQQSAVVGEVQGQEPLPPAAAAVGESEKEGQQQPDAAVCERDVVQLRLVTTFQVMYMYTLVFPFGNYLPNHVTPTHGSGSP